MQQNHTKTQFRLRITRNDAIAIGPGKISLLEAIMNTGSISAAAREFGMSYRRAWMLIDEMNNNLKSPVVETATGGKHGGGATVTAIGLKIVHHYRAIEHKAATAA